ncbi:MAG: GntR family transcriptional regulator [Pyramidobacter sp.]|nr:GntR family transcriptional regulator [Pyramidobacter sp.]
MKDESSSAKDLVVERLRESIYAGTLKPGDELAQQKISEQLGVSRIPVRDALAVLEHSGLVEALPNKRMVVKKITPELIFEDLELRTLLECLIVKKAALRGRACDFEELERINAEMDRAARENDGDAFRTLNNRFHHLVWEIAGNPRLLRIMEDLWFAMPFYYPVALPGEFFINTGEHWELIRAMKERRPDDAAKIAEMHIERMKQRLMNRLYK